jgi:hypothetical protein
LFILFAAVLIVWGIIKRKRTWNADQQQDVLEEVTLSQDAAMEVTGMTRRRTDILRGGSVVTIIFCSLTSVWRALVSRILRTARRYCTNTLYTQYLRACPNANNVILDLLRKNS